MTEKELKRLRRTDLLELLLELSRENERLRQELEETRSILEDRNLRIERAGSLAEAALSLSGIFEAAQRACELYTENVQDRLRAHCGDCPVWSQLLGSEQPEHEEMNE